MKDYIKAIFEVLKSQKQIGDKEEVKKVEITLKSGRKYEIKLD